MADISANITTKAVLEFVFTGGEFGTFSGQLEKGGDHDWIRVELIGGQPYMFGLSFLITGSTTLGSSRLVLRDAAGAEVDSDINSGASGNSLLSFTTTPSTGGTYFLDVSEFVFVGDGHTGEYSLFAGWPAGSTIALDAGDNSYTGIDGRYIMGGKGADTIDIDAGFHAFGEQGNDVIIGNGAGNTISGGLGDDTIHAGGNNDVIFGDAGNDVLFGDTGHDNLRGGAGSDIIEGNDGQDSMYGGTGKDFMRGGPDDDFFILTTLADSKKGSARDVIFDFSEGTTEVIDLADIDAKKGPGNQAFKFIGKHGFHDKAGELHYATKNLVGTGNDKTFISGDVNGDGRADFQIELSGLHTLTAGDFVL
jgi:Ca2+-binding RTX toxin-like protein